MFRGGSAVKELNIMVVLDEILNNAARCHALQINFD